MVDPWVEFALVVAAFTSGALTLLLLFRILYILNANPIGEFTQEMIYLRAKDLRRAGSLVLIVLLLELAQLLYPLTVRQGWLGLWADANLVADVAQGILILAAAIGVLLVVRRYTHRSLDRRIRESMETLAYLEGQRRRRRQVESGEWERPLDED